MKLIKATIIILLIEVLAFFLLGDQFVVSWLIISLVGRSGLFISSWIIAGFSTLLGLAMLKNRKELTLSTIILCGPFFIVNLMPSFAAMNFGAQFPFLAKLISEAVFLSVIYMFFLRKR